MSSAGCAMIQSMEITSAAVNLGSASISRKHALRSATGRLNILGLRAAAFTCWAVVSRAGSAMVATMEEITSAAVHLGNAPDSRKYHATLSATTSRLNIVRSNAN